MELEFDKEINAILRKSRDGDGVFGNEHPDTDAIAAFAENALPEKARLLYTRHFADCGRCRRILSDSIRMGSDTAAIAALALTGPLSQAKIPWYQKILKIPNLALAMGALVIVFGGLLGYMALQNQGEKQNSEVAKSIEPRQQPMAPSVSSESNSNAAAVSNTSANTTAKSVANASEPESDSSSTSPVGSNGPSANTAAPELGRDEAEKKPATLDDRSPSVTGGAAEPPSPIAAKPAPPPSDQPKTEADKEVKALSEDGLLAGKKDVDLAKRKQGEERSRADREGPPAAAKVGPSRSGPLQNQTTNQMNTGTFEVPVTRSAGGKTFQNRNGAWVDNAYHGQGTTDVSRGTETYKKLDKGLRKIVEKLGGVVVIVWKDKAFRIH